jgi:hypothetical protein
MTTSLESGGLGLGTLGMSPGMVSELCEEAGFRSVKQLEIEDEFHALYEIQ